MFLFLVCCIFATADVKGLITGHSNQVAVLSAASCAERVLGEAPGSAAALLPGCR